MRHSVPPNNCDDRIVLAGNINEHKIPPSILSLKDDGNGIDTHKLVQKGLEKDLIKSEELNKMSEEDKLNLMFLPNLSTKESVSEISGRGVGMEVVSNNLRDLGATLDINTINGKGTEFIININLAK